MSIPFSKLDFPTAQHTRRTLMLLVFLLRKRVVTYMWLMVNQMHFQEVYLVEVFVNVSNGNPTFYLAFGIN